MIDAERRRVLEIRNAGTVASEVVSEVLSMLDVEESMLEIAHQEHDELREVNAVRRPRGEVCDDLDDVPGGRDARRSRSASECLDGGHPVGGAAPVPGLRARRLLRLLAPASTPPRTSATPRTR